MLPRSAGFAGFFPDNTGSMRCHNQGRVYIALPSHALQMSQPLPSSLQNHSEGKAQKEGKILLFCLYFIWRFDLGG